MHHFSKIEIPVLERYMQHGVGRESFRPEIVLDMTEKVAFDVLTTIVGRPPGYGEVTLMTLGFHGNYPNQAAVIYRDLIIGMIRVQQYEKPLEGGGAEFKITVAFDPSITKFQQA